MIATKLHSCIYQYSGFRLLPISKSETDTCSFAYMIISNRIKGNFDRCNDPSIFTPWATVSDFQGDFFFGLLRGEWRLHWLDPSCCSGCWEVSIINITTGTMYIHCKERKSNNLEIKESNIVGFCHSFHLTIYRNPQVSWSLLIKTVSYISLAGVKFIVFGGA